MFSRTIEKYAKALCAALIVAMSSLIPHLAYSEAEKPVGPLAITYDGSDWKAYTDSDKIAFLQGFYQGAFYGALKYQAEPGSDETQMFSNTIGVYYYPGDDVLKAGSEEIDKFYSDEDNMAIPVHKALVFIAKEKSNENMVKEESAQWLERARKYWKNQ